MFAILHALGGSDRTLLVWMTRLWPSLLGVVQVVRPETVLRWHRAGCKMFWRTMTATLTAAISSSGTAPPHAWDGVNSRRESLDRS